MEHGICPEMEYMYGGFNTGTSELEVPLENCDTHPLPTRPEHVLPARRTETMARVVSNESPLLRWTVVKIGYVEHSRQNEPLVRDRLLRQRVALPADSAQDGHAPEAGLLFTAINTTIADIVRNPLGYAGRNVAVRSTVEEIYSPWSIRMDEKQMFVAGIDNDILVVSLEPLALLGFDRAWKGNRVRVTGTVRILQAGDFQHEYLGGIDPQIASRFVGKPAIIARSIEYAE